MCVLEYMVHSLYTYIYVCVCMCVHVLRMINALGQSHAEIVVAHLEVRHCESQQRTAAAEHVQAAVVHRL